MGVLSARGISLGVLVAVAVVLAAAAVAPRGAAAAAAHPIDSVCKCTCCLQLGSCATGENETQAVSSCDECTSEFCEKQAFCKDFSAFVKAECIDRDSVGDRIFLVCFMTLASCLVGLSFCKTRAKALFLSIIAAIKRRLPGYQQRQAELIRSRSSSVTRTLPLQRPVV